MATNVNMTTKDGKKMMYLISIGVKEDCENYDAIWAELERRMNAVSIPIVRVDWPLYDDNKKAYDFSEHLFYAQTFETGMGFVTGVMKNHELRTSLDFCEFYNGDAYKDDMKKYNAEDSLNIIKAFMAKHHPNEIW